MLSFAPGGANAGYGLSLSAPTTNPRHWWARVRWGGGLDVVEPGQGQRNGEDAARDFAEFAVDSRGGRTAEHGRRRLGQAQVSPFTPESHVDPFARWAQSLAGRCHREGADAVTGSRAAKYGLSARSNPGRSSGRYVWACMVSGWKSIRRERKRWIISVSCAGNDILISDRPHGFHDPIHAVERRDARTAVLGQCPDSGAARKAPDPRE